SKILAGKLNVLANGPTASITTQAKWTGAAIDTGSSSESPASSIASSSLIALNSDVTLEAPSAQLHIGPNGSPIADTGGLSYTETSTQVIVNPFTPTVTGGASLSVGGPGTNKVTGHAAFHVSPSIAAVLITNDSARDLVINNINVAAANRTTNVQVTSSPF